MIPSNSFRLLLSALIMQALLVCLIRAKPLLSAHIDLNPSRAQSESMTEERILIETRIAAYEATISEGKAQAIELDPKSGVSRAPELGEENSVKLNISTKLVKRAPPPSRPGNGILKGYYLHKNISLVWEHSIEELIRKAAALPSVYNISNGSGIHRERWDHPGLAWMCIFRSFKGDIAINENATYADKLEIFKRIQKAAVFENWKTDFGVPEKEECLGKREKIWFDQNFDRMIAMATPKGAVFMPGNTTDTRRRLIHESVTRVARFQGEMPKRSGWYDNRDRWGGLHSVGWSWGPPDEKSDDYDVYGE